MKLTVTCYLFAVSLLLIFSCKKENSGTCENCITVPSDTLSRDTTSATIPTVSLNGSQGAITVNSEGDFSNTQFEISVGANGEILAPENFAFAGTTLDQTYYLESLNPGTYPIRIKQRNFVFNFGMPVFNISASSPTSGTSGPYPAFSQIGLDGTEVDYTVNLQVNP